MFGGQRTRVGNVVFCRLLKGSILEAKIGVGRRLLASKVALWHHAIVMNAFADLEQVLNPADSIFTAEGARRLVDMPANPERLARMEELGEKANEGQLTAAEHSEYEALIHSGKLMSILRLKAGVFLQNLKAA